MAKPLNQFGGWLSFFHITNWIIVSIQASYFILAVIGIFTVDEYGAVEISIDIVTYFIYLSIIFRMIMATKIKDPSIPDKIVGYVRVLFGCVLLIGLFESFYMYFVREMSLSAVLEMWKELASTFSWYLLWIIYFLRSKRVSEYYGANADLRLRVLREK